MADSDRNTVSRGDPQTLPPPRLPGRRKSSCACPQSTRKTLRQDDSDLVGLAAWGAAPGTISRTMSVPITAPPHLAPDDRQNLTRQALLYMAEAFGFLNASEAWQTFS